MRSGKNSDDSSSKYKQHEPKSKDKTVATRKEDKNIPMELEGLSNYQF